MAYFITPCVATVGMLVCYLLLPHLVKFTQTLVEHTRELAGGLYIVEQLEM